MNRAMLLMGSKREWATIPVLPLDQFWLYLSVWNSGNMSTDWGDGYIVVGTPSVLIDATIGTPSGFTHTYSPKYSGNILINPSGGLKNVYSLGLFSAISSGNRNRLNIDDFGEFINQFPNLYSLRINIYNYQNSSYQGIVSGSLEDIPDSLKRFRIATFDIAGAKATMNINNFSTNSQLEWLNIEGITGTAGSVSRSGDLKNLPANINYFKDVDTRGTATYSYTLGRIWRSDFDTFHLNRVLSDLENDNILIDLANSVISAVGDKVIYLRGARTSASDSAVSYLEGLGFTVTITP